MKSSHTKFKQLTYDAADDSTHRARSDKQKVKKFKSPDVRKKKYSEYIPEQRLWLYADSEKVLKRMVFKLREPVLNN
jgi:hypothetical protein